MKNKNRFWVMISLAFVLPVATIIMISFAGCGSQATSVRPEGPCDIYEAGGTPCVAAHSSTRALYASYNGPLYQVMRQSDGKTLDIGVVKPHGSDPGGYADAAAQDEFCADTYCWITKLYDQSGKENHLVQAPRGGFSGPAMGGFNNLPLADMAPVTMMGHKVYGVFIAPGTGLRWNDAKGTAVDDQAEGQYWVINGHHFNSGCCYDYGNAETDSRDDGDGTMETTYYGNANAWYRGQAPGPWIMTDQENNLVGCVNESPNDKYCADLESITWRFVMATADGEPHHWRTMGGDAQQGDLKIIFDGPRIKNDRNSYDPMRKQGAILLGNGGDNSNGSQGTFYEGAMTAPETFPTQETNQKIQANIVAAKYDVQRLTIAPANATEAPAGLQTFAPQSSQNTTITYTNTSGQVVEDLVLSLKTPKGWKAVVQETTDASKTFDAVQPRASVSVTFNVTSGSKPFNGDLVAEASWTNTSDNEDQTEIAMEKVRNVSPVSINEFRISDGTPTNSTNTFIELYNAGDREVDLSEWTLTHHPTQLPFFSAIEIPKGTKLQAKGFYLLGLSNSGLAVQAQKGDNAVFVRSTSGMAVGDEIEIGIGSSKEIRKIAGITTPPAPAPAQGSPFGGGRPAMAGTPTTVWQPLPDGPVITIPEGSTNIPVTSVAGFQVGQKMAIGYGASYPAVAQATEKYEIVTVTEVGKAGTQAWLSMDAKKGDTNIKVSSLENISVGDKIRLDIDSKGHGIEWVTVKSVGTKSVRSTFDAPLKPTEDPGTGLELEEPLKFDHASNMPFSVKGTGITFEPATKFAHSSNEPVLALVSSITLDQPLSNNHGIDAVIRNANVTTAGYQGTKAPDQWFGGPALSASAGNMVLRDADGNVVDGLNYGGLVDPWASEGYQATSGAGQSGCFVATPGGGGRGFRGQAAPTSQPNRSAGRYPDGADTDSNCKDFNLQSVISLSSAAATGANNIKVNSVAGFVQGQSIIIGSGANTETAVIASVGTSGGTALASAAKAGSKVILVSGIEGFSAGQTIVIDNGAKQETVVVSGLAAAPRRFGMPRGGNVTMPSDTIKITTPLKFGHAVGSEAAGSGITLSAPLTKSYDRGIQVAGSIPTPGEPNQYTAKK